MRDDDKELVRRIMERVRRKHYRPPNPDRVTAWAYAVCCEHLISETHLYEWLLNNGECFSSAYRLVYGEPPHKRMTPEEFTANKRSQGWSYQHIAQWLRTEYGVSCVSEVRRLCDPKAAERQRQHDRDYWASVKANPEKHAARLARMREYSRERHARLKNDPEYQRRRRESRHSNKPAE